MAAKIGDLIVRLLAETQQFNSGISGAVGQLNKLEKRMRGVASVAKAAFAGFSVGTAARAYEEVSRAAISYGDEIAKAAKTANIGADAFQELSRAAVRAGNTQQQFSDAVGRFNRRLGEARNGNKAYEKSFADLGITTKDTTEQALDKAFKALAGISDQSVRTSYATKIFGDDARRMALIVADGADSLDKAREQSRDLGFVLSGELAKKAEEASDRLADMDLLLKNRVSEAVLQNVDGFLSFKQAINDVQIALVEFTAKIGAAYDAGRRFLRLPADAPNEKALRSERADLVTQVDKVRKEREGLVSGKGLFNRIGNVENRIAGADRFIAIREQRIAEIDAALELLSKKQMQRQ